MAIISSSTKTRQQANGVLSLPSASSLLLVAVSCLLIISLLMVASASMPFAIGKGLPQLYFFERQLAYMLAGMVAAAVVYRLPLRWLYNLNTQFLLLLLIFVLLVLTLFSEPINGSKRWLQLGVVNFQVAELAKLVMILFTADYVVRRSNEVRSGFMGLVRMMVVAGLLTLLLLLQPDFGSLVVIVGTILAIYYVAGMPYRLFAGLLMTVAVMGGIAVSVASYRMTRLMSFLDPFDDVLDTDFQLARSLVAFGRGEFFGVGYGESVLKLSHLPEAHTDFLLAITGEELGFVGVITILLLEALLVVATMRISYTALARQQMRLSYTAFGIGILFMGQILINAGMTMGMMPTKGLTMPFFSYGGSSMMVSLVMVGLLLKIAKDSALIPRQQCRNY